MANPPAAAVSDAETREQRADMVRKARGALSARDSGYFIEWFSADMIGTDDTVAIKCEGKKEGSSWRPYFDIGGGQRRTRAYGSAEIWRFMVVFSIMYEATTSSRLKTLLSDPNATFPKLRRPISAADALDCIDAFLRSKKREITDPKLQEAYTRLAKYASKQPKQPKQEQKQPKQEQKQLKQPKQEPEQPKQEPKPIQPPNKRSYAKFADLNDTPPPVVDIQQAVADAKQRKKARVQAKRIEEYEQLKLVRETNDEELRRAIYAYKNKPSKKLRERLYEARAVAMRAARRASEAGHKAGVLTYSDELAAAESPLSGDPAWSDDLDDRVDDATFAFHEPPATRKKLYHMVSKVLVAY